MIAVEPVEHGYLRVLVQVEEAAVVGRNQFIRHLTSVVWVDCMEVGWDDAINWLQHRIEENVK